MPNIFYTNKTEKGEDVGKQKGDASSVYSFGSV